MSFNYQVRTVHWDALKSVVKRTKEIATEIRKDYKRKGSHILSVVAHRYLVRLLSPLSSLVNHRYSDEATMDLIKVAVCRLNTLACEIESSCRSSSYIKELRGMAETLVNFLWESECEGVQLELFCSDTYCDRDCVRLIPDCFKAWLKGIDLEGLRAKAKASKTNCFAEKIFQPLISNFTSFWTPKLIN